MGNIPKDFSKKMKNINLALTFFFLCVLCASAQNLPSKVTLEAKKKNITEFKKSDLEVYVPVTGVSAAFDEIDIMAPFDGRVEKIIAEQFDFVEKEEVLASMVSTEMAAMIDTSHGLSRKQMEKRWKGIFDYYPIKSQWRGVITTVYVEPKQKVLKDERLFTLARKVMIIAKNVKPIFSPLSTGLPAKMHYSRDKSVKFETKVSRFMPLAVNSFYYRLWLDIENLSDDIIVGARFNGFLFLGRVEDAVIVPKNHIIKVGKRKFMMIEIETGLADEKKAEIKKRINNYIKPDLIKMER